MKEIKKNLNISICLQNGEVFISVEEPESGEASGTTLPFLVDEHVEFDTWIGTEIHSWLCLWADELDESEEEQPLDEYPMPDEQLSIQDMKEYGYFLKGMLPVTRKRALELDASGFTVYMLYEDNSACMVTAPQEYMYHGGLFGVSRMDWEKSSQFHARVVERQKHQQERERAFLSRSRDCFAIYQVSRNDPQRVRFMNLDWLKSHDISVDRSNYDLVYTAPLIESGTVPEQLENLYRQFNLAKPEDFHSPSMSVSDIVAINKDGTVSCYYCDSVGFTKIPGFLTGDPLRNEEISVKDD